MDFINAFHTLDKSNCTNNPEKKLTDEVASCIRLHPSTRRRPITEQKDKWVNQRKIEG